MSSRRRPDPALLTAYFEGEVTASERASIEAELRESAEARRTLAQLRNVSELLAMPARELEEIDLASRVRTAVRQPSLSASTLQRRPRKSWAPLWLGGVAACVGLLSFFALEPGQRGDAEFRAKRDELSVSEGSRWAGIQVFRVSAGGAPERVGASVGASDGLLFSYTNLGARPFRYLMVFALDASNQVRWFYPAYEKAGTNPQSIAIEAGRANVALGELLEHDFSAGTLSLYALFTNAPANVLAIESWLTKHGRPSQASPVDGGLLQRIDIRVE